MEDDMFRNSCSIKCGIKALSGLLSLGYNAVLYRKKVKQAPNCYYLELKGHILHPVQYRAFTDSPRPACGPLPS